MRAQHSRYMAAIIAASMLVAACSGSGPGDSAPTTDVPTSSVDTPDEEVVEPVDTAPRSIETAESDELGQRYADGDSSFLFDPEMLHTFEIALADDALAELDAEPAAEEYVEGSLTFDGETLDRVGVRYKGSVGAFLGCTSGPNPLVPSGPKTCTKLSLKLKINWDGADTEFYGQRRVQLHSMNLDQSMLRDRLGYQMFSDAGVAAPRATHARVVVNGEFVGLFALIEQIDGRFTRDRFADGTGNLYKEVWPFDDTGAVRDAAELIDGLETNEDEDPTAEIIQSFAQEILDTDAATDRDAARSVLGDRTDFDALIAYAVVDRAIRNDDGPFHWYCFGGPCEPHNFFLYEDPSSRRIHIIPWDLDNSLSVSNPITEIADEWGAVRNDCQPFPFGPISLSQRSAGCDPLVAAWASLDEEFARADEDFRNGPFAPDRVRALIDTWADQIEPFVVEASAAHADAPTVDEWRAAIDRLIDDFVVPAEQET